MAYEITQNLIPGLPKTPYRYGVSAYEGVVNHATDNTAPAINERNYEASGGWKNAFVHFFVDWTSIIQVADINYLAWGCGAKGNPRYVQIELCQTSDPKLFDESYKRYVWLTAKILKDKNLGVTDGGTLVSHDWVRKNLGGTTHTDPIDYLQSHGISWVQHVTNVQAEYNSYFKPVTPQPVAPQPPQPSVIYQAHVQNIGWQGEKHDGETAGTVGQSLRLEALTIRLENSDARLEMEAHIQDEGWTTSRTNGEILGTVGEALRMEAIKIQANGLNISYRVHVQDIGWMDWKQNGDVAGTVGESKRIEAIEIKLV